MPRSSTHPKDSLLKNPPLWLKASGAIVVAAIFAGKCYISYDGTMEDPDVRLQRKLKRMSKDQIKGLSKEEREELEEEIKVAIKHREEREKAEKEAREEERKANKKTEAKKAVKKVSQDPVIDEEDKDDEEDLDVEDGPTTRMYRRQSGPEETKNQWKIRGCPGANKRVFKAELAKVAMVLKDITEEAAKLGDTPDQGDVKGVWEKIDYLEKLLTTWHIEAKAISIAEDLVNSLSIVRGTLLRSYTKELNDEIQNIVKEAGGNATEWNEFLEGKMNGTDVNGSNISSLEDLDMNEEEIAKLNRMLFGQSFSDPAYWETHYNGTELPKEWYVGGIFDEVSEFGMELSPAGAETSEEVSPKDLFTSLSGLLKNLFTKVSTDFSTVRVLNLGCGSSTLSADLVDTDAFKLHTKNVVALDVSDNVIRRMKEQRPDLRYVRADATKFSEVSDQDKETKESMVLNGIGRFNVVFEKGTFDAVEGDRLMTKRLVESVGSKLMMKEEKSWLVSVSLREIPHVQKIMEEGSKMKWECVSSGELKQKDRGGMYVHVCSVKN